MSLFEIDNKIIFNRVWSMPNSKTFTIKPIKELICKYCNVDGGGEQLLVVDSFANEASIRMSLRNCKYICNDLDTDYLTDYHLEAQEFLRIFDDSSVDVVLYDPPYSGRQVSECYSKLGKTVNMEDTNSGYFVKFKNEITRIVKPNGICISFGWNSNGMGINNGFKIIEILLVAHGGNHNDTICVVERKIK